MRATLLLGFVAIAHSWTNFRTTPTPREYPFHTVETSPFHPKIHTLSNIGETGRIHASGAHIATKIIDLVAYQGRDIREEISHELRREVGDVSVVDIGCSIGMFTHALWVAGFTKITGLDSSHEMLAFAMNRLDADINLALGNAGKSVPPADVYVCGFVMHELPAIARKAILQNTYQTLPKGGLLLVVDISTAYVPRDAMLKGEPFCEEYLKDFENELNSTNFDVETKIWIEDHVVTHWCRKN
jgi:SAM-dependent methyltransferase